MQLRVIGLGRMDGSTVRRLTKHGRQSVLFDRNSAMRHGFAAHAVSGAALPGSSEAR